MSRCVAPTLTTLARALATGQRSSVEVVQSTIDRLVAVDDECNILVTLCADRALREAGRADARRARGVAPRPLEGVPFTIKDSFDTAGVTTTWGTVGRRACVPEEDATVVRRLREDGAILVGKTNTPELTLAFETDNDVIGRTSHLIDANRTPGGSSGGAAVAVASGAVPFEIGSDTGGSIRLPAHWCGVVGLKPTSARVSRAGHAIGPAGALAECTAIGPLTRSVEDAALVLSIIAGEDPIALDSIDLSGRRVACIAGDPTAPDTADESTERVVRAALDTLADAGASISDARPDVWDEAPGLFARLMTRAAPEIAATLQRCGTRTPHALLRSLVDVPASPPDGGLDLDLARFRASMDAFMEQFDLVVLPVAPGAALPHGFSVRDGAPSVSRRLKPFNLSGAPAVSVPAGAMDDGRPIGVQIAARPWQEDLALAAARVVERGGV